MKTLFVIGVMGAAGWLTARGAEESFSKAVRAEDFSSAGLAKLSAEELARLDTLVRDYKSGASASAEAMADRLAAAKREAAEVRAAKAAEVAQAAQTAAEARAAKAEATKVEPKKSDEGLLAKAKKVFVPAGTEVEVAAIESRMVGEFSGWEGKSIFTLENGQRWQVANPSSYYTPPIKNPKVTITPANLGGYWLKIEGVNQRVRVRALDAGR